ncbi:succinylglutamate desuccinylase/aspartoacylase family protein [Thiolinea disciformis]|uniref:succinylglutamate desuccinylase/aspartoacylase family protein n=1 Tax=Thiolinea disciformis TaxID=125614 RepID=UPI00037BE87D|nr:M14 family metallopeptidase [Thiolinea disciformis]
MGLQALSYPIMGNAPDQFYTLRGYALGDEKAEKKVYLQAALHADEQPGMMVLHHLLALLTQADARGELKARFVIFPMVNPLGMSDLQFQQHQGRYDRFTGVNFNRQWPNLAEAIQDEIASQLTNDASANVQVIRQAVKAWLDSQQAITALQQQRYWVMQQAYDADLVLDLHCDNDALPHIFTVPQSADMMQHLSDWMGAVATLTAEDSGGGSFDEVWTSLWFRLAQAFPDKPIPQATHSATLEYRGQLDTFDHLNRDDAERLYGFLQSQGFIAGRLIRECPPKTPAATPLEATEFTKTLMAGLLAYRVELGQQVKKGEVLADLIALDGDEAFIQRTPIVAGTDGIVISRNTHKYVWRGCSIAKVVGKENLASRGKYLLQD